MDLRELQEALEDFGTALTKSVRETFCKVTQSHAERIVDKLANLDQLDADELEDYFKDLGKTLLKSFLK
jgi:hypothetical protein